MNKTEYLLTKVAEEAVEVAQRATKALTFGLHETQEGQDLTNAQRLVYEFNDLVAVMQMLKKQTSLPAIIDNKAIELKKEKIEKWMEYSRQQGTLQYDEFPYDYDNKI